MSDIRIFELPYGRDIDLADAIPIGLHDNTQQRVANPTLQSGVRASRILNFTGAISNDDTVTIQRRDGSNVQYTFKTTLTPAAYEVLIGADQDASLTNLGAAINGTGTVDTDYGAGTAPLVDWEATVDTGADDLIVTAINYGDAYNTAVGNFTEVSATLNWSAATNGVDTPDFKEAKDYGTQANASACPVARNGVFPFAPTAAQLTCKQLHIEFDDDSGGNDFERIDFIVRTTDHPAAGRPNGVVYAGVLDAVTDLASTGATVEIPNSAHGSYGDWLGGSFSVPDTDNVIEGNWMILFNPYTGDWDAAEVQAYDFDGGTGNQGLVTFVTGQGIRIPTTLRGGEVLWYLIYQDKPGETRVDSTKAGALDGGLTDKVGIQKNKAHSNFMLYMEDSNGVAVTGATVAAQVSIDGAAFTNCTNTPCTEIANGFYRIDLTAADLNGDMIGLKFTAAGALQRSLLIVTEAS